MVFVEYNIDLPYKYLMYDNFNSKLECSFSWSKSESVNDKMRNFNSIHLVLYHCLVFRKTFFKFYFFFFLFLTLKDNGTYLFSNVSSLVISVGVI